MNTDASVIVCGTVVYPGSRVSDVLIGGTVLKVPNKELLATRPSSDGGLTAAEVEALERCEADNATGDNCSTLDTPVLCAALRRLSGVALVDEEFAN